MIRDLLLMGGWNVDFRSIIVMMHHLNLIMINISNNSVVILRNVMNDLVDMKIANCSSSITILVTIIKIMHAVLVRSNGMVERWIVLRGGMITMGISNSSIIMDLHLLVTITFMIHVVPMKIIDMAVEERWIISSRIFKEKGSTIIDVNIICPNLVMIFMITVLSMESKDMEERERWNIISSSAMIILKEMLHIVTGMDIRTKEMEKILVMEE
jgi:hypothetical protein